MTTTNNGIARLGGIALGGLLMGLPATTTAFAADAEPITAGEAQVKADDYREQADHYRAQGGVGYNTGKVQAAEANAAKYSALAEQLSAPPDAATTPPPSPEVEHYTELVADYRAQGGVTYKVGLLQWAEAQQRKAEAQQKAEAKQQSYETTPAPVAPSSEAPNSGP